MKATDALMRLRRLPATFSTREGAAMLGIDLRHASVLLGRLAEGGLVVRLSQGRWAFPGQVSSFAIPEALTRPIPTYVSLQSALYHHGMIEQIPDVVYAVTLGPTRRVATPIATVSLHRIAPEFFFGFDRVSDADVATPEKALLDFFYLRPARSRRFRSLPELELPRTFSERRARAMLGRIRSKVRRTLVTELLDGVLAGVPPATRRRRGTGAAP